MSNEALTLARNLVRVGKINSINEAKGTVDVLFEDRDNQVISSLPLLANEYDIPKIGEQALCLFLGNDLERGFCLKTFYSDVHVPPVADKDIYRKQFDDGTFFEYKKDTREFSIYSNKPITIKGNLNVQGNIVASGTVTASNIG
jgi:phage baseplate assembly protein V